MGYGIACLHGQAIPHQLTVDGILHIGRDPHCDIRLLDDGASRYHARVEPQDDGVLVVDNKSSNGTHVSGKHIVEQLLTDGETFTINGNTFLISCTDSAHTRVVTDSGVPLTVTQTQQPHLWTQRDDPTELPALHVIIRRLNAGAAAERGRLLAKLGAQMCDAQQGAVILRGFIHSWNMHERLARRLASGKQARILVLGHDLIGQTVATQAIGSAIVAPLGNAGFFIAARDLDQDPFVESELNHVAHLAADASYLFPQDEPTSLLIGQSQVMVDLRKRIERIGSSDVTVLITGESGTGKELTARELHMRSGRREGPFIAVNCAAISPSLFESELFGHVAGAFTGADRDRLGRFREADGGTLFLDEIGEMPREGQAKLLRALQEQSIQPVGASTTHTVHVRVIAATNRQLQSEVDAGNFRSDLYYRLDVIRIRTPPIREHLEDLPLLCRHLLDAAAKDAGIIAKSIDRASIDLLAKQPWPGNVRQLANTLTRALVLGEGRICATSLGLNSGETAPHNFPTLAELEANHIRQVLQHYQWNKSEAAKILGISRPTIHKKITDYGLKPESR